MSKQVVLLGDLGSDHQGFPPTPVIAGSPDVLIDGKPAARVGDPLAPHSKPKHPPHPRAIAAGSATVLINGIPAAVTGGAISCGGVTIGSGSVVIGDTHSPAPTKAASQAASPASNSDSAISQSPKANGSGSGVGNPVAGGPVASSVKGTTQASTPTNIQPKPEIEPGFHVVQTPVSKTELLSALYGDASAKPNSFDWLNPDLGAQVLPGEMIVLGDPEGTECTQKEAELMEAAARVNAQVRSLEPDEAEFLVKYYDLLEAMTSTGSAGLGAGAVMVSKQLGNIENTLKNIEVLHQESYRKHGHLNHPEFFEKRRALFKELDFALGSVARKGMSLDDDAKLKRSLGLSSKSIVNSWKSAGIGDIPGYATNYERVVAGAKYAKGVGYLAIGLDVAASGVKIHAACTTGQASECRRVKYVEGGRLSGSIVGGSAGAFAGTLVCGVMGLATAGPGGIACGIIMAGVGGFAGGAAVGGIGEDIGEVVYEVTIDE
ncbi:hypothetical protein MARI_01640 [Marinobacter sp. JH2]|nr:type VI secretion system PAAR protein [Marinobacter sp. JH2]QBM16084.1 hypothetical protein MARI_01640 [Marinobacter sp. JH2]